MLDIAVAYNRFRFLGHEFLTWLFFAIDTDEAILFGKIDNNIRIDIGNKMVLENRKEAEAEKIVISGEQAGLEEAFVALSKGALITEINLIIKYENSKLQFTLKGESLCLGSIKLSETGALETSQDLEAAVLEKIYLYEKIFALLDKAYESFLDLRISDQWKNHSAKKMKDWIGDKNRLLKKNG